jgi:Tetratricopeptide repeat
MLTADDAFILTLNDRAQLGPDHPDTLASRNNLAEAYREAGRTAEAIPLHQQTLGASKRVLGVHGHSR